MKKPIETTRVLGYAFLIPFLTSFVSGAILKKTWLDIGTRTDMMLHIANVPWQMQTIILVDMATALGVIFLGCILYLTLRDENEIIAITSLGFYILEGILLAVSTLDAFSLIRISQAYAAGADPALMFMGELARESMSFGGNTLHMLAFCAGGVPFYFLLFKSRLVPRALSLWGLITTIPMLIGTLAQVFGSSISFYFYAPYVPFELVIGLWILIKGIPAGRTHSIVAA